MTTTKEIKALIKAIRPLIGKEVNVIKDDYTIKARLLGYSIGVGTYTVKSRLLGYSIGVRTYTETLTVIVEAADGWSLTSKILDKDDKVRKKFLDKGLCAKYEVPYDVEELNCLPCVAFLK